MMINLSPFKHNKAHKFKRNKDKIKLKRYPKKKHQAKLISQRSPKSMNDLKTSKQIMILL